jgi:hypothetical protein
MLRNTSRYCWPLGLLGAAHGWSAPTCHTCLAAVAAAAGQAHTHVFKLWRWRCIWNEVSQLRGVIKGVIQQDGVADAAARTVQVQKSGSHRQDVWECAYV